MLYTSTKVSVGLIRGEVEGLPRLQSDIVEKEHTETTNITRKLVVEAQHQRPLLGGQT